MARYLSQLDTPRRAQIFFLDARRDEWIDKGAIITGE
jgi:hypothetical protein